MKKIKKIGGLLTILLLNLYTTCFADVAIRPNYRPSPSVPVQKNNTITYVIIGVLVVAVIICAIFIIRSKRSNNKEKASETTTENL